MPLIAAQRRLKSRLSRETLENGVSEAQEPIRGNFGCSTECPVYGAVCTQCPSKRPYCCISVCGSVWEEMLGHLDFYPVRHGSTDDAKVLVIGGRWTSPSDSAGSI